MRQHIANVMFNCSIECPVVEGAAVEKENADRGNEVEVLEDQHNE